MQIIKIWKPIQGYEGRYEVSNLGEVRSLPSNWARTGRILKQQTKKRGYKTITLHGVGKPKTAQVHSIVCTAFQGVRPVGTEVRHMNGISSDNREENLRWGTHQDNANDAKSHGVILCGEALPQAKLTDTDIAEIIRLDRTAVIPRQEIGERYGVTEQYVRQTGKGYTRRARRVLDSGVRLAS